MRRKEYGVYDKLMGELRNEDPSDFQNFMRMPPNIYNELLDRLRVRLTKKRTREPLEPGLKLAITLRHLASGNSYVDMSYSWRVPHNTISIVVREVCKAIFDEYADEMLTTPDTEAGWRAISTEWYKKWNFPHTIGAIDGKHIACKSPPNSGSEYFNYKGFFSIILLALVDSDYKFLWADLSGTGSSSDAQVYNASDLKKGLEEGTIAGWPRPDPLPHDREDKCVPYFILGDDAFALRTYLMKPYSARRLIHEERIFNYRLSRARRVVENAFGIMVNRFRVLLKTMDHHVDSVKVIVKACIVLHNLLRSNFRQVDNHHVEEMERRDMQPGAWRSACDLADTMVVQGPNRASRQGKMQRNLLKHWCNSPAGSVPWQEMMVAL